MRAYQAIRTALILAMALTTSAANAQSKPFADVKLDDGSSVRLSILHDVIDVQTKYGKLAIPVSDIRRIEFGLHIPIETQIAINRNLKRLGSQLHKERESASAELLGAGHFAISSLRTASKGTDQEVALRAAAVLATLGETLPGRLLDLPDYDVVYTLDGTVRGKVIIASGIKATSPHFGEVTLQVAGIRSIIVRSTIVRSEIVVDAAKHGEAWLDTGVDVYGQIHVTASGTVDLWPQTPGQHVSGSPKGFTTAGKGGQFMAGALIGRIGESGKAFFIGDRYDGFVADEGRLYLQIVQNPWNGTSAGTYSVKVTTSK